MLFLHSTWHTIMTVSYFFGLEHPEALSILVDLIPPTQPHQQPAGHILKHRTSVTSEVKEEGKEGVSHRKALAASHLDRPEVKREQSDDQDKTRCKALADPVTQQIGDDGNHPEEQVEKGGEGVSEA